MTVKDLIAQTMRLIGRSDCAESIDNPDDEIDRMKQVMLFCYNAVVDELARGYFPLKTEEEMESEVGEYSLENFAFTPLKILKVTDGKKPIKWRILSGHLGCAETKITVEYEYAPSKAGLLNVFSYPDYIVSDALVTYGMAAEYLLICGDIEGSSAWESKYRTEIDRLLSLQTVRGRIPPRRWL